MLKELLKHIGKPFKVLNDDGTLQGCTYPLQVLYGDKAKITVNVNDYENTYIIALKEILKYCIEIDRKDLKQGDIIITKFCNEVHCAIYYEFGKIIHTFKNNNLQIGRLNLFKDYKCFRVVR